MLPHLLFQPMPFLFCVLDLHCVYYLFFLHLIADVSALFVLNCCTVFLIDRHITVYYKLEYFAHYLSVTFTAP